MAAEIHEITESNLTDWLTPPEVAGIHAALDELLALVRKHDELLERFRPLLDQYAAHGMIGMAVSARRARRAGGREQ